MSPSKLWSRPPGPTVRIPSPPPGYVIGSTGCTRSTAGRN
jgi:hypothetical protein